MPFEAEPFNGDTFLQAEVKRLAKKHGHLLAVETGTCYGSTAMFLHDLFGVCYTAETNAQYAGIALKRFGKREGMDITIASGAYMIISHGRFVDLSNAFVFLDAHGLDGKGGGAYYSCVNELEALSEIGAVPKTILLHDFQVPDLPEAGFDTYNGQPFTLEWVAPYLDSIYGEGKWKANYPAQVAGAKRGWISIERRGAICRIDTPSQLPT